MQRKIIVLISTAVFLAAIPAVAETSIAPMAPGAPGAPGADKIMATWSKWLHKHLTREELLKQFYRFPSEQQMGVKAYPGSVLVDWKAGGGSAADGDDVPMVELATKASLKDVIAWYKTHYPNLKPKRVFETAGPGIVYLSTSDAQYRHAPADVAAAQQAGNFTGCNGMLAVPKGAGYQTGVDIYYTPFRH